MPKNKDIDYSDSKYYVNREISWLLFDERVLSEANDKSLPLFERLKFLSITASNLDEFYMVRVASLRDMEQAGYNKKDIAGLTPKMQLKEINAKTHKLVENQYKCYDTITSELEGKNLVVLRHHEELDEKQAEFVDKYFMNQVYPVLTPMAVDSSRPFPLIANKTLNLGALLKKKKDSALNNGKKADDFEFAMVQVPGGLPRILELPGKNDVRYVILLEEVIERNIPRLFMNYDVICAHPFRIMRNADLGIDEDEAEDLLKEIEKQLKKRKWGQVIRLEVENGCDKNLLEHLKNELMVPNEEIYEIPGPLDLTVLMKLYGLEGYDAEKEHSYEKPQPVTDIPEGADIFECIRQKDIVMHHPYESFDPVVNFVRQAAKDENVLAIKQTLYRVSGNSPIVSALAQAAENGKQVSVLFELKARFDEENNIIWARKLEQAGCHVIYGLVGLKTHSKITLVVRKEEDGIRRYVHLGTGNYNDSTAKLYTDVGLFTCDEEIGEDATAVFNMLSGYSEPMGWNKLSVAPLWLKDKLLYLIDRETQNALNNKPALIRAKMNSLCDTAVMEALYKASAAGVKIELVIRGICCLKVGIKDVSENIHVRSIVGNYLEHGRIFYFENDGRGELYCASADWMPRNLDRRVEIMFPIEDPALREKVLNILDIQLKDTEKAHILKPDGSYVRVDKRGKERINSQLYFSQEAKKQVKAQNTNEQDRIFIPRKGGDIE